MVIIGIEAGEFEGKTGMESPLIADGQTSERKPPVWTVWVMSVLFILLIACIVLIPVSKHDEVWKKRSFWFLCEPFCTTACTSRMLKICIMIDPIRLGLCTTSLVFIPVAILPSRSFLWSRLSLDFPIDYGSSSKVLDGGWRSVEISGWIWYFASDSACGRCKIRSSTILELLWGCWWESENKWSLEPTFYSLKKMQDCLWQVHWEGDWFRELQEVTTMQSTWTDVECLTTMHVTSSHSHGSHVDTKNSSICQAAHMHIGLYRGS